MRFKVGDLVQFHNEDGSIKEGVVVSTSAPKKTLSENYWSNPSELEDYRLNNKDYVTHIGIKCTDGTEEELEEFNLNKRDSELERQFRIEASSVLEKIYAKLEEASKALSEAEDLSEKNGIPFHSYISPLNQSYFPKSFAEKFEELDRDFVSGVTDAYIENGYDGWEHSAIC
jgi:hypothetical protein